MNMQGHGLPFIARARYRNEIRRREGPRPRQEDYIYLPQSSEGPVYLCPLSTLPFSGQCPVRACPGCKPDIETGGCLYLFYRRTKLDRSDIMFSYKLNEKKLLDTLRYGQEQVKQAISFYKALNEVRSRNMTGHCPSCGVGHTKDVYACKNTALCEARKEFAQTVLRVSFLAFAENQGTLQDVYIIARNLPYFENVAQMIHSNMCDLLGIDAALLADMKKTTTIA